MTDDFIANKLRKYTCITKYGSIITIKYMIRGLH